MISIFMKWVKSWNANSYLQMSKSAFLPKSERSGGESLLSLNKQNGVRVVQYLSLVIKFYATLYSTVKESFVIRIKRDHFWTIDYSEGGCKMISIFLKWVTGEKNPDNLKQLKCHSQPICRRVKGPVANHLLTQHFFPWTNKMGFVLCSIFLLWLSFTPHFTQPSKNLLWKWLWIFFAVNLLHRRKKKSNLQKRVDSSSTTFVRSPLPREFQKFRGGPPSSPQKK